MTRKVNDMKKRLRDNLLVTIGMRAAYMDELGKLTLPRGVAGEEAVSIFAAELADKWMSDDTDDILDTCFDIFIETALIEKYGEAGES